MKVLLVSNNCWNIKNFRGKLVKQLLEEGYSIEVVAPKDGYQKELIDLGCSYKEVKFRSRGRNPISEIMFLTNLCFLVFQIRPDVILSFTAVINPIPDLKPKT